MGSLQEASFGCRGNILAPVMERRKTVFHPGNGCIESLPNTSPKALAGTENEVEWGLGKSPELSPRDELSQGRFGTVGPCWDPRSCSRITKGV